MPRPFRLLLPFPLLMLGLAAIAAPLAADRQADHVVLISIDGLRPEFYLDTSWPAPMIQQMARQGTRARGATGVYPSVTYPTHTSIITGALPIRHGIFYNSPFEPGGSTGRWYWEADAIRLPTLWDAVRAAGLESASISWPVSVDAPVDWNMPETWSITADATAIDAIRAATHPPGLFEELEREAAGRLTLDTYDIDWITRDSRTGDIAAYLLTSRHPALMTVHLTGVDHFQHDDGRDSPRVRRALATVDSAISQIVEAADRVGMLDRTTFVITGDHGFLDIHTRLAPNVWLVEAGLRPAEWQPDAWRATFHTTAASAFLHMADPDDDEALAAVEALLAGRPAEERALFEVLDRDALAALGAAPEAALGLALAPGVDTTSSAQAPAVRPGHGANHGFLPELPEMRTGFIVWGAGAPAGRELEIIGLVDIAPLVAHLLDLDLETPDGRLPEPWAVRP